MEKFQVEFLTIIDAKEQFCTSVESFNSLVQTFEKIKVIKGGSIKYEGSAFEYSVQKGNIVGDQQRYFHVTIACEGREKLKEFKGLVRSLRTIAGRVSDATPEVLRDDISSEMSSLAYPIIHRLENMMRKLLTKFMYITIGINWTKDAVPKEVSDSIRTKKNEMAHGYLHEADFIQLSNFLFKEYVSNNAKKTLDKIKSIKDTAGVDGLNVEELKELIPRSNWERYFAQVVQCKSDYLLTQWEKLYKLRCMVAHNNYIKEDQYNEIVKISAEVSEKLSSAIDHIDQIVVSSEEREEVAENIAGSLRSSYHDYITMWNTVTELLVDIYFALELSYEEHKDKVSSPSGLMAFLSDEGYISRDAYSILLRLLDVRNAIVHSHSGLDEEAYLRHASSMISVKNYLSERLAEIEKNSLRNK